MKLLLFAAFSVAVAFPQCGRFAVNPATGKLDCIGTGVGAANIQSNITGPATSTGAIDVTSLQLVTATLNSLTASCWTGTGITGGKVSGDLTPLACSITTRSTSAVTVTFSSSSNVLVVINASGGAGATGATGQGVPTGGTTAQVLSKIDNTNYNTQWVDPASGTGTVTVVGAGAMTSTAIATGGGTTTIQTPSATATLDASGNISTPGGITAGAGGSAAGLLTLGQGTAPSVPTGGVTQYAHTSVTGYKFRWPSAAGTGFFLGTNTTNDVVGTFVGSSGSGSVCLTVSCAMTTPNIGAATATSVNRLTITAPASGSTLTIPDGVTMTGPAASGTVATLGNTNTLTGRQDATGAASTGPMKTGTSLPGTCTVGDLFFKSDATAGQNIYECPVTNTWTQQLNSGGFGDPGSNGIMVRTSLNTATPRTITASKGVAVTNGDGVSGAPTFISTVSVNAQTGTTYAIADTDCGGLITYSNSSAAGAWTIAQAGTAGAFASGCSIRISNIHATGIVAITPTTSTIDGQTIIWLFPGSATTLVSNGTDYVTTGGHSKGVICKSYSVAAGDMLSTDGGTYNGVVSTNAGSSSTDYAKTCAIPASFLNSGRMLRGTVEFLFTASSSAPTEIYQIKLGGTALITTTTSAAGAALSLSTQGLVFLLTGTATPGGSVTVNATGAGAVGFAPAWRNTISTGGAAVATNGALTFSMAHQFVSNTAGNMSQLRSLLLEAF